MKTLKILMLLLVVALLASCKGGGGGNTVIQGIISDISPATYYLYELSTTGLVKLDSSETSRDGELNLKFNAEETGFYILRKNDQDFLAFVAGKGDHLTFQANGNNLSGTFTVEGSEESETLASYFLLSAPFQSRLDSLSSIFEESRPKKEFPAIKKELDSMFFIVVDEHRAAAKRFLQDHKSYLASLFILNQAFGKLPITNITNDIELYQSIDSLLARKYAGNSHYSAFHDRVQKFLEDRKALMSRTSLLQVGEPAPEIRLPDMQGVATALSSLKGKIVFLYFWASWNPASRELHRDLVTLNEENKSKDFRIFAVNLDEEKAPWVDAMKKDKAYWTQVNDASGLNSGVTRNYKVAELPASFLLGKDGKILAVNPTIREVRNILMQ